MLCANELEILRDLTSKTGRETSRIRQVRPLQAEFGMGEGRLIIAAPSGDRTCLPQSCARHSTIDWSAQSKKVSYRLACHSVAGQQDNRFLGDLLATAEA